MAIRWRSRTTPSAAQPPYEHYDGILISAWAYGRAVPGCHSRLSHETGHWTNLIHVCGEAGGTGRAGMSNYQYSSTNAGNHETPTIAQPPARHGRSVLQRRAGHDRVLGCGKT